MRVDGFRAEYLDFQRGIRVGHLEPHERITQILKLSLEERHRQSFVTDRWGRGVYWQWICFLPKANRLAKPLSSTVNFGCGKYFIMIDREAQSFKAGLQIERGFITSDRYPSCQLREDWDWHRLLDGLRKNRGLMKELRRLVAEDFCIQAGWDSPVTYTRANLPSGGQILKALESIAPDTWGGFQLYYPMAAEEVKRSDGPDLVDAMLAVFEEVTPVMNVCMQIKLDVAERPAG